jgi:hypothetical protein
MGFREKLGGPERTRIFTGMARQSFGRSNRQTVAAVYDRRVGRALTKFPVTEAVCAILHSSFLILHFI